MLPIYNKIKGYTYEQYTLEYLFNDYDQVYYFKNTPEYILSKTKLFSNKKIIDKYLKCDIGIDLVAIKDNNVYMIQCKNHDSTISVNDLCSFAFILHEYDLNGIFIYNGTLSERLLDLSNNKIQFVNLPYNNTLIDVNINSHIIQHIPRDYQIDIYNNFKNINKGIISLPCGTGKSYSAWLIGKDFNNIIIISPTRSLTENTLTNFYNYSNHSYNPILISMDGYRKPSDILNLLKNNNIISVTYDSVDILNNIITNIKNRIIIVDEFHNLSNNNLTNKNDHIYKLLCEYKHDKIIFLSATPPNVINYENIFGSYVYKYNWNTAIEKKYICNYSIIIQGELNIADKINALIDNLDVTHKKIIKKIYFGLKSMKFYGNKKMILYVTSIKEALQFQEKILWMSKMLEFELDVSIIDYKTSKLNRIDVIKQFKYSTKSSIIINVQILNEGIDIPECDSVYITKPNNNIINLIQRMSRCNRIMSNKYHCDVFLWCTDKHKIKICNLLSEYMLFCQKNIIRYDEIYNNSINCTSLVTTSKINPILINNILYIQLSELCKLQPKNTNLCKTPYYIIQKYNFIKDKDYFLFCKTDNSWIPADGSNKKYHKAFVLLSVIYKYSSLIKFINCDNNENNKNQYVDKDIHDLHNDNLIKYPIINLKDIEKFRDMNGNIYYVETRGVKKYDQIYFRVSHIALCFNIKDLRRHISDDKSSYTKNIDYTYINTSKANYSMFLTYRGLVRCLFVSHSKKPSMFIDWCIKPLFASQFKEE